MRKIIVQKFGGTSVADTDKIKNVAQTVIREKNNGNTQKRADLMGKINIL